jgi:hypothetical protein
MPEFPSPPDRVIAGGILPAPTQWPLPVEQKKTIGLAKDTRGQLAGRDSSGGHRAGPPEEASG